MISKHYKVYKNFGKCLEISNGTIKAMVTVDVGPRIIYYGYKGFNLLFEDIDRTMQKGGEYFDKNFKEGEKWFLYGGHRLWRATEDLDSYVPDNYPVKVEKFDNGAVFIQKVQQMTGLQLEMRVEMSEDGKLTVKQKFTNTTSDEKHIGAWGVTAMRAGGVEIIPLNDADTGLLPNQNFVYWPYSDRHDKRISMTDKYAVIKHSKKNAQPFKISLYNHFGWAGYYVGKFLYVKRFEVKDGNYTDFQSNYETWMNNYYLETEAMGPMVTIAEGETTELVEYFEVYKDVALKKFTDDEILAVERIING